MLLKTGSLPQRLLWSSGLIIAWGYSIGLTLIFFSLIGCSAGGEGSPSPTPLSPAPKVLTVRLVWDPSADSSLIGYFIHYGKQSPNQPGSCAYDQSRFVSSPQGTVTIELDSIYYFAVSAYNGVEGGCSTEVRIQT